MRGEGGVAAAQGRDLGALSGLLLREERALGGGGARTSSFAPLLLRESPCPASASAPGGSLRPEPPDLSSNLVNSISPRGRPRLTLHPRRNTALLGQPGSRAFRGRFENEGKCLHCVES